MSLATLVPGAAAPAFTSPGDWWTRGACYTSTLDLSELTTEAEDAAAAGDGTYPVEGPSGVERRPYEADLDAARRLCSTCPVLERCRVDALAGRQATGSGVIAGLTEAERAAWRREHRAPAQPGWVLHLIERDGLLLIDLTTVTRSRPNALTAEELVAVARLIRRGLTSQQIAAQLVTIHPGPVETPWDLDRVKHARRILRGTRGAKGRIPGDRITA